jgi:hypothetical protein
MENKSTKCAHPSCDCDSVPESKFCSTYCEGQAETADIICSCGHAHCAEPRRSDVSE